MKKPFNAPAINGMRGLLSLIASLCVVACVSSGRSVPAPVEDHATLKSKPTAKSAATSASTSGAPATSSSQPDAVSKPGYYTVKQGDTLIRIGLDHGQNWRDKIGRAHV